MKAGMNLQIPLNVGNFSSNLGCVSLLGKTLLYGVSWSVESFVQLAYGVTYIFYTNSKL